MALGDAGFSEEDKIKLVGGCFRTAQKNRWLQRTSFSQKSIRNNSNLHSVWYSNLFRVDEDGREIPKTEIESEYLKWRQKGLEPPDRLAQMWLWQKEFMDSWEREIAAKAPEDSPAKQLARLQGVM